MRNVTGEVRLPLVAVGAVAAAAVLAMLVHNHLVPFGTPFFGITENNHDLATYRAAINGLFDGKRLYASPVLGHAWFVYPPFAVLPLAPLAWMSFDVGKTVLLALSLGVLSLVAWRILRLAGLRADIRLLMTSALLAVVAVDIEPVQATLWWGQINIALMAAVLLDLLRPKDARWRGVGLGLAAGIKLTPLIFLPYLLLTRQWRTAGVALTTFIITIGCGWAAFPRDSAQFFSHLGQTDHLSQLDHLANQTINGYLARYFAPAPRPEWLWLTLGLAVFAAGLAVALWAHRRGETALALVLVGLTGCVVSPFSWAAHWVWFAPAVWWVASKAITAAGRWPLGWLIAVAGLYAATFMWTLHRPGPRHTTMYFSGVYWNWMDLRRFWVGQLMSGWYPLVFLAFLVGVLCWLCHAAGPRATGRPPEIPAESGAPPAPGSPATGTPATAADPRRVPSLSGA